MQAKNQWLTEIERKWENLSAQKEQDKKKVSGKQKVASDIAFNFLRP